MILRIILIWIICGLVLMLLGLIVTALIPLVVYVTKIIKEICNGNNKGDT